MKLKLLSLLKIVQFFFLFVFLPQIGCQSSSEFKTIKLGLDVLLEEQIDLIKGKRVGIITNQTGVNSKGKHIVDLLHQSPYVKLVALFGPEHGIRGNVEGGFRINYHVDEKTGVPIFSIYGKTKKPTPEMLKNIDVLIFDIQDVGTRFYTYISTMSLCMEAAAENGIQFIVLDRPNPITGNLVEGPVLKPEFKSFVGIHPIALRHGMTVGELAKMFNEQGWLANGIRADLYIVKMKKWRRSFWYGELGLKWVKPSPNMPTPTTALLYPGMGLLEACNVSEGRGTTHPFENIGAPWIDHLALKKIMEAAHIPGIQMDTTSYVPVDIPGAAMNPKYEGERCKGLSLKVIDPQTFPSVSFGIHLICAIRKLHPDKFKWRTQRSSLLMFGEKETPQLIMEGQDPEVIMNRLQKEVKKFSELRKRYLLYE